MTKASGKATQGGGARFASLALRGVIGGTMLAHGIKHARSLEGTAGWFGSIGFRSPKFQATSSAVVEIGSGVALLAGAATPLAASAVVGTMGVAARSVHLPNGFFITAEGYEYVLALSTASVALAALGAGSPSIDSALGWGQKLSGTRAGLLALGLGIGGAAAHLAAFWRKPEPAPEA